MFLLQNEKFDRFVAHFQFTGVSMHPRVVMSNIAEDYTSQLLLRARSYDSYLFNLDNCHWVWFTLDQKNFREGWWCLNKCHFEIDFPPPKIDLFAYYLIIFPLFEWELRMILFVVCFV